MLTKNCFLSMLGFLNLWAMTDQEVGVRLVSK